MLAVVFVLTLLRFCHNYYYQSIVLFVILKLDNFKAENILACVEF